MGCLMCKAEKDLPPASAEEVARMIEKVANLPEYENGAELTLSFADEDRPDVVGDCFYDTIRAPLFGRNVDIESIIIIGKGDQAEIAFASFEKRPTDEVPTKKAGGARFVLWVNTWNHLMGEKNNNPKEVIMYCDQTFDQLAAATSTDYVVRLGTRAEVDARFHGCISTVKPVMTAETAKKLGKRLRAIDSSELAKPAAAGTGAAIV